MNTSTPQSPASPDEPEEHETWRNSAETAKFLQGIARHYSPRHTESWQKLIHTINSYGYLSSLFPQGTPSSILSTSNILKPYSSQLASLAVSPSTLGRSSAALTKVSNLELGYPPVAARFRDLVDGWGDLFRFPFPDLSAWILDARIIPENLAELGIDKEDIDQVVPVLDEGIPLFWIPRARIARRLLDAPTPGHRRTIIGGEVPAIISDCRDALDLISDESCLYEADRLREAAELLPTHTAASQSLSMVVLDSLMFRVMRADVPIGQLVTSDSKRTKANHREVARGRLRDEIGFRGSLVFAPVYASYSQFKPKSGEAKVPRNLNRHASLHRIDPLQYTKRNATIALMQATSVLLYLGRWFDSELSRARRRA